MNHPVHLSKFTIFYNFFCEFVAEEIIDKKYVFFLLLSFFIVSIIIYNISMMVGLKMIQCFIYMAAFLGVYVIFRLIWKLKSLTDLFREMKNKPAKYLPTIREECEEECSLNFPERRPKTKETSVLEGPFDREIKPAKYKQLFYSK